MFDLQDKMAINHANVTWNVRFAELGNCGSRREYTVI